VLPTRAQTAIPASWRYFENRDSPAGQRLAEQFAKRVSGPLELSDEVVRELGKDRARSDDVSDEFIDNAFASHTVKLAREQVTQALAVGIESIEDPLPGLPELFDHLDTEPPWLDWAAVERGAKVLRSYGTDAFRYFGLISIMGYRFEMIHKPLALTGAYTGGSAFRRFLETCKFWTEVSEPDALRQGGEGRRTAVMVRVLHSIIRHTIRDHAEWDSARLGVPLSLNSQFDTISLSFLITQQLKLIGYLPTDQEVLDHMHFWRYVGYLMGVEPAFYPDSMDDWWRVSYLIALQDDPLDGPDSVTLSQSFIEAFGPDGHESEPEAREKARDRAELLGWTKFFLRSEDYRAAELPPAGWHRMAPLRRLPGNLVTEAARRVSPSMDAAVDERRRRARRTWLDGHLTERPAQFAPVERLTR
jgi:hypothetical protein